MVRAPTAALRRPPSVEGPEQDPCPGPFFAVVAEACSGGKTYSADGCPGCAQGRSRRLMAVVPSGSPGRIRRRRCPSASPVPSGTGSRGGRAPGSSASGDRRCRLYASTGRYDRQKKGGTARLSRLSGTGGPCRHQLRSSRSSRGIRLKMPPPRIMPTSSQRLPVSSCRRARRRPWSSC